MLVLTRKVGEGIVIGEDTKIFVMQIKGRQVRLGIKASASTGVHREEVFQRITEENSRAARVECDIGEFSAPLSAAEGSHKGLKIFAKVKK